MCPFFCPYIWVFIHRDLLIFRIHCVQQLLFKIFLSIFFIDNWILTPLISLCLKDLFWLAHLNVGPILTFYGFVLKPTQFCKSRLEFDVTKSCFNPLLVYFHKPSVLWIWFFVRLVCWYPGNIVCKPFFVFFPVTWFSFFIIIVTFPLFDAKDGNVSSQFHLVLPPSRLCSAKLLKIFRFFDTPAFNEDSSFIVKFQLWLNLVPVLCSEHFFEVTWNYKD